MKHKVFDCRKVHRLLALRVTDDLHADESAMVDQHVRYCDDCRRELESLARSVSVLHTVAEQPLATDAVGLLWDRVEPRLGPAGRMRSRPLGWLSTRQLAAACAAMFMLTVTGELVRLRTPTPAAQSESPPVRPFGPLTPVADGGAVELRPSLGIVAFTGAVISEVARGSAAARLGLEAGDVIITIDNVPIRSANALDEAIVRVANNGLVPIEVIRGGRICRGSVRIGQK